ncbi:hypothetical protein [Ruegeria meonggei]|uniref:Uncharacterized protein n=1 Tax=Ruegeria meonggei TaxID=1446476 RepID=A0A1X7A0B1_9RHOB|nr:hypothetical protein [Ruegeria meonggei]SLN66333.1 hypothetical protein RUM8411_03314 [Ruegeria meonggei]
MFGKLKGIVIIGVLGFVAYSVFLSPKSEQTADLGQVLDRTEFTIAKYQEYLDANSITEASNEQVDEFAGYLAQVMNSDPKFYDKPLGIEIESDAKFLGFADANANNVRDTDEGEVFTIEIDEANNRLIATDTTGESAGLRFSGAGFLAGALLGNLLSRQRSAGIKASSFNNRSVTPRTSYAAPRSSRSGGLRAGK